MFMEETIGKRINVERTEEALGTLGCGGSSAPTDGKTKVIAAACPFCSTMLTDGLKTKEKQDVVVVKDLAEILDAST